MEISVFHQYCPLCKATDFTRPVNYPGLIKCKNCKLIFQYKIPNDDELKTHYGNYPKNKTIDELTVRSYKSILKKLNKYRINNTLIELGCGNGFFIDIAKKSGWNVSGTEIDPNALRACRNKGLNVEQDIQYFSSIEFDTGIMIEVIEHLKNPSEMVEELSSLLRKGGCIYISTPNFNSVSRFILKNKWSVITYPEHLFYFTPRSIDKLLRMHGFRKISLQTTGISPGRLKSDFSKTQHSDPQKFHEIDRDVKKQFLKYPFLEVIKNLINFFLNIFKAGDTIKCLYEKA